MMIMFVVCLFVSISQHVQASPILLLATYGPRSVFFCRRCDMLCTSGFVDDVIMFAHNGREYATRRGAELRTRRQHVSNVYSS